MQLASATKQPPSRCPANRPAERLVLDGYRRSTAGPACINAEAKAALHQLYEGVLGARFGATAARALGDFIDALGLCAICPKSVPASGPHDLHREEVLIIGLIAGIQNGDDVAAEACLRALTCPSRCEVVAMAAGNFALIMRSAGMTLLPVPKAHLDALVGGTTPMAVH